MKQGAGLMQSTGCPSVAQALASGCGVAFLSEMAVQDELEAKRLEIVNIRGVELKRQLSVVLNPRKYRPLAVRRFLDMSKLLEG